MISVHDRVPIQPFLFDGGVPLSILLFFKMLFSPFLLAFVVWFSFFDDWIVSVRDSFAFHSLDGFSLVLFSV